LATTWNLRRIVAGVDFGIPDGALTASELVFGVSIAVGHASVEHLAVVVVAHKTFLPARVVGGGWDLVGRGIRHVGRVLIARVSVFIVASGLSGRS
jgi:hypothetical protein